MIEKAIIINKIINKGRIIWAQNKIANILCINNKLLINLIQNLFVNLDILI